MSTDSKPTMTVGELLAALRGFATNHNEGLATYEGRAIGHVTIVDDGLVELHTNPALSAFDLRILGSVELHTNLALSAFDLRILLSNHPETARVFADGDEPIREIVDGSFGTVELLAESLDEEG